MHSDARLQFRYFPDIERELLIRAHTQKTWLTLTEIYKDHVVVPIAVAFGETTHAPCGLQGIADSAQHPRLWLLCRRPRSMRRLSLTAKGRRKLCSRRVVFD
jgi:hypothetical protein